MILLSRKLEYFLTFPLPLYYALYNLKGEESLSLKLYFKTNDVYLKVYVVS